MNRGADFAQLEMVAGLRHAIDDAHGRLVRAARAQWEHRFGDAPDPSDAIARVRIRETQRGAAFLPGKKSASAKIYKIMQRFAD